MKIRIVLLAAVVAVSLAAASSSLAAGTVLYDGSSGLAQGQIPFPYQSFVPGHVTVVPDPTGLSRNVMQMSVNDGDRPYKGATNPRADFETSGYFSNGSDLYYSIEFLIPANFPVVTSSGWMQISEIYGPPHGGSPPIGIDLVPGTNGRPRPTFERDVNYGYDHPWTGPTLDTGWHQIIVHTRSAPDNTGFVQLWFDGQPQTMTNGTTTVNYPTLASGINWDGSTPNVLNVNFYRRAGAYPGTVTMYHAAARVGTDLASVMGSSGPTTAAFTTTPSPSTVGTPVTFDASGSVCAAAPCTYSWTVNRQSGWTGRVITRTFNLAGVKAMVLTVKDANGATSSVEHDLTVN